MPCNLSEEEEEAIMASKADTGGNAKAGKKKAQKKGAPFSGVAGAFDAANDATMALGPLAGLAREDFIGAIGLMLRQLGHQSDIVTNGIEACEQVLRIGIMGLL